MRRLLKFSYSLDNGALVKYERPADGKARAETITLESHDGPKKALKDALQKMEKHLREIADLPDDWKDDLEIRGVTCTWSNDIRGLVITGLRKLTSSNSPLVLNSPHFTEEPYSETADPDIGIFSEDCLEDLEVLENLAFKYVDGDREQLELDLATKPSAVLHAAS